MKYVLFFVLLLNAGTASQAQTAGDSVKTAVNLLFDAMKSSDSVKLVSAFADGAILQSITTDKDGAIKVGTEPVRAFASIIKSLQAGAADERIQFETIRIDGALAIVWAPYQFYYNGKLTHCGADSFQLVRSNGKWKIQYLIDTRRKDCQ